MSEPVRQARPAAVTFVVAALSEEDVRDLFQVQAQIAGELETRATERVGGWPDASMHDHAAILDGPRVTDPEAVRVAMEKHIVHAGELLIEHADLPGVSAGGS